MTAYHAARKIRKAFGRPSYKVLIRYGVEPKEAEWFMRTQMKRFMSHPKPRKPLVFFGHRTK